MLRAAILALIGIGTVNATVIGNLTTASLGFVNGRSFTGQTFIVPRPEKVGREWRFWGAGFLPFRGFRTKSGVAIYDWRGGLAGPCPPRNCPPIPGPATTGVYSLTGLNVPLISGQSY